MCHELSVPTAPARALYGVSHCIAQDRGHLHPHSSLCLTALNQSCLTKGQSAADYMPSLMESPQMTAPYMFRIYVEDKCRILLLAFGQVCQDNAAGKCFHTFTSDKCLPGLTLHLTEAGGARMVMGNEKGPPLAAHMLFQPRLRL